jgi:deoxyribose-phosphate aldolase
MKSSSQENTHKPKYQLSSMIEHTLLDSNIDEARLISHINEALELDVFGVCVPMAWVPLAKKRLSQTSKQVITVIDFPLGQKSSLEKAHEAHTAQLLGADEIDMVLDYQAVIKKDYVKALSDLKAVVDCVAPLPIKVIVETSALSHEQLAIACALVALSGAQFIKTSTGFHKSGAQASDIACMHALLPKHVSIKASGGIKDFSSAMEMIKAGATRIGSSKSRDILRGGGFLSK